MKDSFKEYEMTEQLLCAAIWFPNEETPYHTCINKPNGVVMCGHRHGHIIGQFNSVTGRMFTKQTYVQGFITTKNRFLDRHEAHKMFTEQGGKPQHNYELYSEDLY